MQLNGIKPIINRFIRPFVRKNKAITPKNYLLESKELNLPADSIKITAEQISSREAATADKVVIAKADNPEQKKIITTFRDKSGKIIEIAFQNIGLDLPEIHKVFTELDNFFRITISGRLIQTFENLSKNNSCPIWAKISTEKQFVHTDYMTDKKAFVTITKVSTQQRDIKPVIEEMHSITEYPVPYAHYKLPDRKSLVFRTRKDKDGIPQITEIVEAKGVSVPQNDEYLALRMYDSEDIKKPITAIALKKANLNDIGINLDSSSYILSKGTQGNFDAKTGTISFSHQYDSKIEVIDTAFHETEHARQYDLIGRAKLIDTKYTKECLHKHGELTSENDLQEAREYYQAHKNYVSGHVDYEKYANNLLERKAREQARYATDEYMNQNELADQFFWAISEEL